MHTFASSSSLVLGKLIERFDCPTWETEADAIRVRVCLVLNSWLESQPDDFDESMLSQVSKLAGGVPDAALAEKLKKELLKIQQARKIRRAVFSAPPTECGPVESGLDTPFSLILKVEPGEIARQLTLIDFGLFSAVELQELQGQQWSKPKLRHRSPNVVSLVTRLNRISYWIATVILAQDSDESRAATLSFFIEVAKALRNLNNFHSLMGVVAGLNTASVSRVRLKQTWAKIPELAAEFEQLETLMSPSSSFKLYRQALKQAKLPAIPYLGSVCGDLTFLDEGNPDMIDG